MKHLIIILTFTTLAALTACNSYGKKTELKSDAELENKFKHLTQLTLEDTTAIAFQLDTLTNFSWDTVIILTPYLPIEKLEKETKLVLKEIKKTNIESNDGINVLAFIKRGLLIKYVALPRNKGDFSQIIDNNRIFTKDNCHFELVQTDDEFVSGQTIVIVKPINTKKGKSDRKNAL